MTSSERLRQVMLRSAAEHNVLPLASGCNVRCLFCSHALDYPGLDVYRLYPRDLDLVWDALEFLRPDRKVVLGESATRIIEGEPLTHPRFFDVLSRVRQRLPNTTIQVTTNGSLLGETAVEQLAHLSPVQVSLSLNTHDPQARRELMRDRTPEVAIRAPGLLADWAIPFDVSLVVMPGEAGVEALRQTLAFAADRGARRAKVYVAGCSQRLLDANDWSVSAEALDRLYEELTELQSGCAMPLTCQPPRLKALEAEVAAVRQGSPAELAGLRSGDVITSLEGSPVPTRHRAHQLLEAAANPTLELVRGQQRLDVTVAKQEGGEAGAIFDADLPLERLDLVRSALNSAALGSVLVLTSLLAQSLIESALEHLGAGDRATVAVTRSELFGGTIACAGLLTARDFAAAGQRAMALAGKPFALVLLPEEAFDERGLDLLGASYLEVEQALGVPTKLV